MCSVVGSIRETSPFISDLWYRYETKQCRSAIIRAYCRATRTRDIEQRARLQKLDSPFGFSETPKCNSYRPWRHKKRPSKFEPRAPRIPGLLRSTPFTPSAASACMIRVHSTCSGFLAQQVTRYPWLRGFSEAHPLPYSWTGPDPPSHPPTQFDGRGYVSEPRTSQPRTSGEFLTQVTDPHEKCL